MNYTIENEFLKVTASDLGAGLVSVISKADGCEYIWHGDEKYWSGQAPVLFPICCRLFGGYYTYEGRQYFMKGHGFARRTTFDKVKAETDSLTFKLKSNEEIKEQYPFDFTLDIRYKLNGCSLTTEITVRNKDTNELIFADGGHPGFNVPFDKGAFEDWYVEFDKATEAMQLVFSDDCFQTGIKKPYAMENGRIIHLRHDMFDNDAVFLDDTCHSVTLKSDKSEKYVRIDYPTMRYLGIWHTNKTDAPFVCLEPMNGLPSFDNKVDDLSTKSDMTRLAPGDSHTAGYTFTFGI